MTDTQMTMSVPTFLSGLPYLFKRKNGDVVTILYSGCAYCGPGSWDFDENDLAGNPMNFQCTKKDCRAGGRLVQQYESTLWDSVNGWTSDGLRFLEHQYTRTEGRSGVQIQGVPDYKTILEYVPEFESLKNRMEATQ